MKDFSYYLNAVGEVGDVQEALTSIVYASGLPHIKPSEVVVFETGELGQVLSMTPDYVEILPLSSSKVQVGTRVARTNQLLEVPVGPHLLGKTIDPLGKVGEKPPATTGTSSSELRPIDVNPRGLTARAPVSQPLGTGVTWVDMVVPLGKGQRELVIGDRKTGKTSFLMQTMLTQAGQNTVCIYAAIGKRRFDIAQVSQFFEKRAIKAKTIVVASASSDPAGYIFLTPYTAMTLAEYFRDQGRDVLIVLDDLTTHAKYYREIALLANRFPGRSSYPGDIFYIHSRLLERAGKFSLGAKEGNKGASISCLPVAETVLGDFSGYIQTNLMAMTDGHIFFDNDLVNLGRRPAVNPFLSVTRVGYQTQSNLLRDINRQLRSFLVRDSRMREFLHFGAELSESIRRNLALGDRVLAFFDQSPEIVIPVNANIVLLAALWGGFWRERKIREMKREMSKIIASYAKDVNFRAQIDTLVNSVRTFSQLVGKVKENLTLFKKAVERPVQSGKKQSKR